MSAVCPECSQTVQQSQFLLHARTHSSPHAPRPSMNNAQMTGTTYVLMSLKNGLTAGGSSQTSSTSSTNVNNFDFAAAIQLPNDRLSDNKAYVRGLDVLTDEEFSEHFWTTLCDLAGFIPNGYAVFRSVAIINNATDLSPNCERFGSVVCIPCSGYSGNPEAVDFMTWIDAGRKSMKNESITLRQIFGAPAVFNLIAQANNDPVVIELGSKKANRVESENAFEATVLFQKFTNAARMSTRQKKVRLTSMAQALVEADSSIPVRFDPFDATHQNVPSIQDPNAPVAVSQRLHVKAQRNSVNNAVSVPAP